MPDAAFSSRRLLGGNFVFALPLTLALAACSSGGELAAGSAADAELAGTTWKLVAFQSMDDAQGTTTAQGREYLLTFNSDGTATGKFDCNRANTTWAASATSGDGGSLTLGPVAMIRALCPPPQLDEKLGAHLPHVASYTLHNGHLFLALKMDGGIFEFEPN